MKGDENKSNNSINDTVELKEWIEPNKVVRVLKPKLEDNENIKCLNPHYALTDNEDEDNEDDTRIINDENEISGMTIEDLCQENKILREVLDIKDKTIKAAQEKLVDNNELLKNMKSNVKS